MSSNSGNPELSALWILYETSGDERAPAIVIAALKNNDGDVTNTAKYLRISRPTLYKWIQDHEVLRRVRARMRHLAQERAKGGRP
jgi:transcriptional regulator of acetoin/glycerol metabolism